MILCCGEALIDFVPLADVGGYMPCPGGSVYNVAVGLGRLETPVGFFCKVSTDFFGDQLLALDQRVNHTIEQARGHCRWQSGPQLFPRHADSGRLCSVEFG